MIYGGARIDTRSFDLRDRSQRSVQGQGVAAFFGQLSGQNVGYSVELAGLDSDGLDDLLIGALHPLRRLRRGSLR